MAVIGLGVLKKQIGGCDILDLGTVFGLQKRNRVDQHRLVGDQFCCLLQLP
jgi:hypothetical protein